MKPLHVLIYFILLAKKTVYDLNVAVAWKVVKFLLESFNASKECVKIIQFKCSSIDTS